MTTEHSHAEVTPQECVDFQESPFVELLDFIR